MNAAKEWKTAAIITGLFLAAYALPVESVAASSRLADAILEALYLVRWYAREHVLLCLLPAFFIAGAITVFVRKDSVLRYLGPGARKPTAYGVASVSGGILAVCSCTVLPIFGGITAMGAGIGPAATFLYAGPAINVLAVVLTGRVLGIELGIARAVGAVLFSILIGLSMHLLFRREAARASAAQPTPQPALKDRPLRQTAILFAAMIGVLVFANWGEQQEPGGVAHLIFSVKWHLTGAAGLLLACALWMYFGVARVKIAAAAAVIAALALVFHEIPEIPFSAAAVALAWITATDNDEAREWFTATWDYTKQITPLLLIGVLAAGFLLGRPGQEALIPSAWVSDSVGGNGPAATFFAAIAGAFMYFATLTEIPVLEALMGAGMGKGPALALLLAGPALSLPSVLVLRSIIGARKTMAFSALVIVLSTIAGLIYGALPVL